MINDNKRNLYILCTQKVHSGISKTNSLLYISFKYNLLKLRV